MSGIGLGKILQPGEILFHQGDIGDCMYVIQSGEAEVIRVADGKETRIAIMGTGDLFGEMAILQKESRSATVKALTEVTVLTIDKRTFLRRVQEDPSLAFTVLRLMSRRVKSLDSELAVLKDKLKALEEERSK